MNTKCNEYATPTVKRLNVSIEAGFQASGFTDYGDHGDTITPGDEYNW